MLGPNPMAVKVNPRCGSSIYGKKRGDCPRLFHFRNHQSALDNHQSIPRDPCVSAFVQKVTKTRGLSLGAWPFGMAFTRWFYAPLGRTMRLRISVDCTLKAIQVVLG